MDVSTGERLWYVPLAKETHCADPDSPACSPRNRAGAIMIPGVLFTGSADGVMRAYSTTDGAVVWEFNMNREFETVNGVPGRVDCTAVRAERSPTGCSTSAQATRFWAVEKGTSCSRSA